jgi:hypothetical protein
LALTFKIARIDQYSLENSPIAPLKYIPRHHFLIWPIFFCRLPQWHPAEFLIKALEGGSSNAVCAAQTSALCVCRILADSNLAISATNHPKIAIA